MIANDENDQNYGDERIDAPNTSDEYEGCGRAPDYQNATAGTSIDKEFVESMERKNTSRYRVTQTRSHAKVEKRETTIVLPDEVTPDDIVVDSYFEHDAGFTDAGQEPSKIRIEWEVLEHSNTDSTLRSKVDIRNNLLKDFAVTRDELITLGIDYLKNAYALQERNGYGWDRGDRWDFAYWWTRFKQIYDYIATLDGVPCFEFEAHIHAHEKLLDKIYAIPKDEWFELLTSRKWAWSEKRKAFIDFLHEAERPPVNEQLKKDAIVSWEKRKERASEIRREADRLAGRIVDDEPSKN